jgi:hypothetical protein
MPLEDIWVSGGWFAESLCYKRPRDYFHWFREDSFLILIKSFHKAPKKMKKTKPPKSNVYDVGFVGKIDFSCLLKIFGFLGVGLSKASAINGRVTIFIGFGKILSLF